MHKKLIVNSSATNLIASAPDFEEFQHFELEKSVFVSNSRSITSRQEMEITSSLDIVEIQFEDQSTWIGNAQEFQEIFNISLSRGLEDDTLEVPSVLQSGNERGIVQDLAVRVFSLFKPKKKNIIDAAVHEIAKKVEEKVQPYPGLFLIDSAFRKTEISKLTDVSKPYLLFIHGTNSNTEGAFGGLFNSQGVGLWKDITNIYGKNILAFDHKTLTESPLQNTQQLVALLPANITLHIITHSRGGLIGDLLARTNATNTTIGFTESELELLGDRASDLKCMNEIMSLAKHRNIKVEKFIRVASPSMGTSLLSERLDHYLNTALNLIGIGTGMKANPVYLGVKALLSEAASSRCDIDVLPGLEAMTPESPFIKMLNNPANVIDVPLTVISGNCSLHVELKALLVILTKLYFRRKNDMVVDTWSMYFGTPRRKAIQFFLDDNQGTDHTHYFNSKKSQDAISRALESNVDQINGFKTLQDSDIAEANRNAALPFIVSEVKMVLDASGNKPIAVIIPGIMGSNLYNEEERIWVDFWRFVKGDLVQLGIDQENVRAKSLMGSGYKKLANYLSKSYDVIAFAYDWRKDLTTEAEKLDELIKTLLPKNQPIHILAHSMGGVLFREFMFHGSQWPTLNNSTGFKTLFLGAPLGGSYLIPETLTGNGGNINKLSMLDLKNGKKDLLRIFAQCPGLYHLLPLTEAPHDFGNLQVWQSMFNSSKNIGIDPSPAILKNFQAFRKNVHQKKDSIDYKNIIYVAGKDDSTTASFAIENNGRGNKLVFKATSEGDGSVTWASGIPKELKEKDAVYYCPTTHGELANDPGLFPAFTELLSKGSTTLLRKVPPLTPGLRGGSQLTNKPAYEILPITSNNIESVILGIKPVEQAEELINPIKISVSNGDLRDAKFPLIVGHFNQDGIMGPERVLDINLDGMFTEKHALGIYPGKIGTNEVVLSNNGQPKGAIVVGLGEPGELNGHQLELSVTQGVTRFLLELREFELTNVDTFNTLFGQGVGVSTVIIGAGYGGLSIDNSIQSIILGIQKSNEGILSLKNPSLKTVDYIEFVEIYEDRSLQAFYTLKKLAADSQMNIVLPGNSIKKLFGIRKRVPLDEQQDWWQRISVSVEEKKPYDILKFSASTNAAREELRNLYSNPKIIQHFIEEVSKKNHWSPELAKTIFELLIPNDFKDAIRNQNKIVWKLDKYAAAFPWELLQDISTQSKPLCVNAGMVRQLATSEYRTQIKRSYKNNALVIGDPLLNGFVHQLEGAAKEAEIVAAIIQDQGYLTTKKINTSFPEIIQALFQEEYKIIHLAGHGDFNPLNPEHAGMIIGDDLFLTAKEIDQMSQVPEFVFINCCHLGAVDARAEKKSQQFYKLAANIGVQLIQMGVKAVIAAGWAVHDAAAFLFADVFYKAMFNGNSFGNALKAARSACFRDYPNNNTWGAYQCYGDQFYTFRNIAQTIKKQRNYVSKMEIDVDLTNISNNVESGRYEKSQILLEIKQVSQAIDSSGLRDGYITEKEAMIFAALDEKVIAIQKMSSLRNYEEADFSVKTLERLCNLNIKLLRHQEDKTANDIEGIIKDFEMLRAVGETSERLSLLGSAYKILLEKSISKENKLKALSRAAESYHRGFEIASKNNTGILYPLCNWLQMESLLMLLGNSTKYAWGQKSVNGYSLPNIKQAYGWLEKALNRDEINNNNLEFWKLMDDANVLLTKLCMEPKGKATKALIFRATKEAWSKGGSHLKKQSVVDHISFLINVSGISTIPMAKMLHQSLDNLQKDLEKLR